MSSMGTVFSGRWPMEGGAVTRGRGPGARGGGGRWPARGAVSPAVARRRPTAIFVRRDGRDSPRRTGSARAVAIDRREVLRRSSGAARKDSCTACERTAFTPCRRTPSTVDTRRRWRGEPTPRSSSAAGVRTSRGGDDTSDSKTLPEYSRDPHAMEGASRACWV
jgi:hypothetical protein